MVSAATGIPRQSVGAQIPSPSPSGRRGPEAGQVPAATVPGVEAGAQRLPPRQSAGPRESPRMPLPQPRGPLTAELIAVLTGDDPAARGLGPAARVALRSTDVLTDDDLQLYLTLCYEMHYRGLDGVSDSWEWNPALLLVRSLVERVFESALHRAAGSDRPLPGPPGQSPAAD